MPDQRSAVTPMHHHAIIMHVACQHSSVPMATNTLSSVSYGLFDAEQQLCNLSTLGLVFVMHDMLQRWSAPLHAACMDMSLAT